MIGEAGPNASGQNGPQDARAAWSSPVIQPLVGVESATMPASNLVLNDGFGPRTAPS